MGKHQLPLNIKLVLWFLLYRVPVEDELTPTIEQSAVVHAKFKGGWSEWLKAREKWPKQYERMLTKRRLRAEFQDQHGSVPDGWSPPVDGQNNRKPSHIHRKRISKRFQKSGLARLLVA